MHLSPSPVYHLPLFHTKNSLAEVNIGTLEPVTNTFVPPHNLDCQLQLKVLKCRTVFTM